MYLNGLKFSSLRFTKIFRRFDLFCNLVLPF